ncbi:hypothetical protein KI387_010409, partial [Taxus chinensis]
RPPASSTKRDISSYMAGLCWHILHFIVTIVVFVSFVINKLWYLMFSKVTMEKYRALRGKKPQIVGMVIESQEAEAQASKICDLLLWLSEVGVKHVSLYDMEGVLKQHRRVLEKTLDNLNKGIQFINTWEEHRKHSSNSPSLEHTTMTVELLSFCDGKEGIAKAARYLCSDTLQKIDFNGQRANLKLTEADIDRGLEATGCAGPEPDLLFVFGFTRCLLGFPAWRLRLSEI